MKKKNKRQEQMLVTVRQTRSRDWGLNPVTQIVANKKAENSKKMCRIKII